MPDPIVILDYDPQWVARFEREQAALLRALMPHLIALEHVGSTAVPGLAAKPIVDIAANVRTLTVVADLRIQLAKLGYRHRGQEGLPSRHYFTKPADPPGRAHRQFQLHLTQVGSPDFRNHLRFRDFLRAHPAERDAYEALKRGLADEAVDDIAAYIAGKTVFVRRCLALAELEAGSQ